MSQNAINLANFIRSDSKLWANVQRSYEKLDAHIVSGTYDYNKAIDVLQSNVKAGAKVAAAGRTNYLSMYPYTDRIDCAKILEYWFHKQRRGQSNERNIGASKADADI